MAPYGLQEAVLHAAMLDRRGSERDAAEPDSASGDRKARKHLGQRVRPEPAELRRFRATRRLEETLIFRG